MDSAHVDSAGFEVLSRQTCLDLLASVAIGRLVFTDHALPAIQPVAFTLHDEALVIRLPQGSPALAAGDAIVAFEIDNVAHDMREGWTVTVIGHAQEVHDPNRLKNLANLHLPSHGVAGTADRYLVITVELVNGTRIPHPRHA
ncbi:pyridoxamine 5'-phosphate oxidase family protein [Umezawaea sp. Da 62-37]|uniref:pyridoxamine 5'-phosphate oxidase family protein n=1 Tax=Umezawaea sp. Da 62-37 TaxID=3075927 RepID=UPI0028F74784|nr:pyridoxamine 5'-phosphate oxidase family protein [Umezawaea sp. Da 62-37]WNV90109.1 pyridoxamine 5'-phosphate oxidase family protein [Umezawaea sp. Da 62-37]